MRASLESISVFVLLCSQSLSGSLGQESDEAAAITFKRAEVGVRQADLDKATADSEVSPSDVVYKRARLDVASARRKRAQVECAIAKQANSPRVAELERRDQLLTAEEDEARQELSASQAKAEEAKARMKEAQTALVVARIDLEVTEKPRADGQKRLADARLNLCEAQLASAEAKRATADAEIGVAKAKLAVARINVKQQTP